MTGRRALAGIAAMAALLGPSTANAAAGPPAAAQLLAGAAQLRGQLALLGQGSGPLGLPGRAALAKLSFTNRDGYTISVIAYDQTVALKVSRGRRGGSAHGAERFSATTYLAHGEVTATSIRASFADRGRIAVRFRPSGRKIRASGPAGCGRRGKVVIGRRGLFVGDLRFRGEGDYTSADAHRVRGASVDFRPLAGCRADAARTAQRLSSAAPGVGTHPSAGPTRTTLLVRRKLPVSQTAFEARRRGSERARFAAIDASSEGSIGIVRFAIAAGPRSAFAFDGPLASAAVAPPAPFSGEGAFQHGPGGEKSWSGSLAVSFLGAPRAPLTGPAFRAVLAQSW